MNMVLFAQRVLLCGKIAASLFFFFLFSVLTTCLAYKSIKIRGILEEVWPF